MSATRSHEAKAEAPRRAPPRPSHQHVWSVWSASGKDAIRQCMSCLALEGMDHDAWGKHETAHAEA